MKRFIDSALLDKEWFQALPPGYRMAYVAAILEAKPGGVWEPNCRMLSMKLGVEIDRATLLDVLDHELHDLGDGKVLLLGWMRGQHETETSPHPWRDKRDPHTAASKAALIKRGILHLPEPTLATHEEAMALENGETLTAGASEPTPETCKVEPSEWTFILGSGGLWTLPQAKLDEYVRRYPKLDVPAAFTIAQGWLSDNPSKRKTARGMTRFLGSWLTRAEERRASGQTAPDYDEIKDDPEALRRYMQG